MEKRNNSSQSSGDELNSHKFISELKSLYSLESTFIISKLSDGKNPAFILKGNKESFILRIHSPEFRSISELLFELELLRYLSNEGISVSSPVYKKDGSLVTEIMIRDEARMLALYSYVPGRPMTIDEEQSFKFGKSLAQIHNAADLFLSEHKCHCIDAEYLVDKPLQWILPFLEERSDEVNYLVSAGICLKNWISQLPVAAPIYGVCHGDAHHLNACINNNESLSLFDFEHVGLSWRIYDIATFIWGTFGRGGNGNIWKACVQGYELIRQLSEEEAAAIPAFVALRHIWWMGFHARHWGSWDRPWLNEHFFTNSMELFYYIIEEGCGLDIAKAGWKQ